MKMMMKLGLTFGSAAIEGVRIDAARATPPIPTVFRKCRLFIVTYPFVRYRLRVIRIHILSVLNNRRRPP
jgi:hypothetical protein